jgi:Rod binding domain-containing protein
MSAVDSLPTTSLPAIDQAREPASVRDGSPATQKAYQTALSFEEMLVQQLSQSLVQTSGLSGEGEGEGEGSSEEGSSGGEAGSGVLSSMLPQTLTEGMMRQGGLGLATQLMGDLDHSAAVSSLTTQGADGGISPAGSAAPSGTTSASTTAVASTTAASAAVAGATGGAAA